MYDEKFVKLSLQYGEKIMLCYKMMCNIVIWVLLKVFMRR